MDSQAKNETSCPIDGARTNDPLISIIIPVFQVERFLNRCVDSVINQTYQNLEIILVDDGSTDNSGMICDDYSQKDSRIIALHKENGGLSDARNCGVIHAHGEYILFVDSDDYVSPDIVSYLYRILEKEFADISCCSYIRTSKDQESFPLIDEDYVVIDGGVNACKKQMTEYPFMTTAWAKLLKRELAENNPFPKGRNHEDLATTYKYYFNAKRVVVSNNKLYAYFVNTAGISLSFTSKNAVEVLSALEERLDYFDEHNACELYKIGQTEYLYTYLKYKPQFDIPNRDKRYIKSAFHNDKISIKMKIFIGLILCFGENVIRLFPALVNVINLYQTENKRIRVFLQYCMHIRKATAVLMDTPEHGNIGDQAIAVAESQMLSDKGIDYIELTAPELSQREKYFARVTPKSKVLFVHGGGFLGCLYPKEEYRFRKILQMFPENRIIVFPQTITFDLTSEEGNALFQKSKTIYEGHKNLVIFVREVQSYFFMREKMPDVDVRLVPDVVTNLHYTIDGNTRNGILLCMRADHEKLIDDSTLIRIRTMLSNRFPLENQKLTDTFVGGTIQKTQRILEVGKKLDEFDRSKLVVTDRLHGMVFAALTGTPCIALDNSNGKVNGVYQWIKNNPYVHFADGLDNFKRILDSLDIEKTYGYDRTEIETKIKSLECEISQKCNRIQR